MTYEHIQQQESVAEAMTHLRERLVADESGADKLMHINTRAAALKRSINNTPELTTLAIEEILLSLPEWCALIGADLNEGYIANGDDEAIRNNIQNFLQDESRLLIKEVNEMSAATPDS